MSTPILVVVILGSVLGVALLGFAVMRARGGGAPAGPVCQACRRVMRPDWPRCLFCGWMPVGRLEFVLGPLTGHVVELRDDVTTVGSVVGNSIVLADPAVSRKHAGIRRIDGGYELADLGSTNGIYVNGHRLPKKNLVPGDVIRVGNSEAVFRPQ
ncbi:MAG: FHA domain-containing protein [Kofleriaceae bacterium]